MVNKKTLTSIVFASTIALSSFAFAEEKKAEKDLLNSFGLETKDYVVLSPEEQKNIRGSPNNERQSLYENKLKNYFPNPNLYKSHFNLLKK